MLELEYRVKPVDYTELQRALQRLMRAERDLESRLAGRAAALDGAGAPVSDPLYHRLFFALAGVRGRRVDAEAELSRRAGGPGERGGP
jgi:hypothetical protein